MSLLSRKLLDAAILKFRLTLVGVQPISVCKLSTIIHAKEDLASLDPQQVKSMEEMCILVDSEDRALGPCSKKECHLMTNIRKGMIHRAFSVFLFNSQGQLLIQQRSDAKITFPGCFTNSCCSHPLHTPEELEENDAVGVKRAAQRRLNYELGIPTSQLGLKDFTYLTRFLYEAPSNGLWGEREVDYILVAQKDVDLNPNPNEIKSLQFVSKESLDSVLESLAAQGHQFTPWFRLIVDTFLNDFWTNLKDLEKLQDHNTIHKF